SAIDIALIPRHSLIGPYFGTYPPKSAWKKCGGNSSTLTVLPGRQARWGDDQKGDRTYEIEEDKQSARISAGAVVVPGGPGPGGPGGAGRGPAAVGGLFFPPGRLHRGHRHRGGPGPQIPPYRGLYLYLTAHPQGGHRGPEPGGQGGGHPGRGGVGGEIFCFALPTGGPSAHLD